MPNVYNTWRTGLFTTLTAAPRGPQPRSFIPTEQTQACGRLSRVAVGRWLWGHSGLGLNLGSAAYLLCDPSKFLNLFELQFPKITED